jgi:putative oxidoreductase
MFVPLNAYSVTGGMIMHASYTSTKLIRYAVAFVFIISGLMKIVSLETAHHFLSLGLPYPQLMLKVVIFLEIGCGILLLVNKSVKNAVIPLIAIIIAAILLTKIQILSSGIVPFLFNARLDFVLLVLLYILYKRYP